MCRNIKPLFNFDPPATEAEITASAVQYVRKVSGFRQPSQVNQVVWATAVAEITAITQQLLDDLVTKAPPRSRAARAQARNARRF